VIKTDFLPISKKDLGRRGWRECDVILITGDAYVDHPSYGAAVISRVLEDAGFRVGIIAQPDWRKNDDFARLGKPKLFFGITAGNLDSILSNYSVNRKIRRKDAYSPAGRPGLRPNRASIVYSNRVREIFPGVPIVLGGIEASMRRLAHYDYWSDEVRRSILLDAKADMIVYGMGECATVEIARKLSGGAEIGSLEGIRGTAVVRSSADDLGGAVRMPSYDEVRDDKDKFNEAFRVFYSENDPVRGRPVAQQHGNRFVVQFPPPLPLSTAEIDAVYELPYARNWHPVYDRLGGIPGFEVVRNSIVSHRGCPGECGFCSLYAHQGRIIQSRSKESILNEAALLADSPGFKGTITDIGGPTANLFQAFCENWGSAGACADKSCLTPGKCPHLKLGYDQSLDLWSEVMRLPKIKHLFISSGLRYDLLIDKESDAYLRELCRNHISGQLKVAPEHSVNSVLKLMNKPSFTKYGKFAQKFWDLNRELGKRQYLVNYFVSAHPGAGLTEALGLALYLVENRIRPEQVQDFIPLPMTASGCMYHTGKHPVTGEKIYVAKETLERQMQRALLQHRQPQNRQYVLDALRRLDRPDLKKVFCVLNAPRGPFRKKKHEDSYDEYWEL
jgi:uncharacterized radical SAM protein YgiQ